MNSNPPRDWRVYIIKDLICHIYDNVKFEWFIRRHYFDKLDLWVPNKYKIYLKTNYYPFIKWCLEKGWVKREVINKKYIRYKIILSKEQIEDYRNEVLIFRLKMGA